MHFVKQGAFTAWLIIAMVGFVLGTFGLPHLGMTMKMDMDGHMKMSDCLMPGMTAICNMTPIEHAASWKSMFTNVLLHYGSTLLFLLLAFAIAWYLSHRVYKPERREEFIRRYRNRETGFDSLRLAIADGVVHSKAF